MRTITLFSVTAALLLSACAANAYMEKYTFTFDEFLSGSRISNSCVSDLMWIDSGFKAVDHTNSDWGHPHSPNNVMVWDGDGSTAFISFEPVSPDASPVRYSVDSFGAYFGTQLNSMVEISAYRHLTDDTIIPVTSLIIGGTGQTWDNRYLTIDSSNGCFDMLTFEGVNSPDDLRGFCLDDLTVTPVPEPSSILALFGGLAGVGGVALGRRRR